VLGTLPRLASVDIMHMATAQQEKVDGCHSCEPKWAKWSELIGLPISEPEPMRPLLGLPPT
jgi:hypothetical protein